MEQLADLVDLGSLIAFGQIFGQQRMKLEDAQTSARRPGFGFADVDQTRASGWRRPSGARSAPGRLRDRAGRRPRARPHGRCFGSWGRRRCRRRGRRGGRLRAGRGDRAHGMSGCTGGAGRPPASESDRSIMSRLLGRAFGLICRALPSPRSQRQSGTTATSVTAAATRKTPTSIEAALLAAQIFERLRHEPVVQRSIARYAGMYCL